MGIDKASPLIQNLAITNAQNLLIEHILKANHYSFGEFLFNIYTLQILGQFLLKMGMSKQFVFLILLLV